MVVSTSHAVEKVTDGLDLGLLTHNAILWTSGSKYCFVPLVFQKCSYQSKALYLAEIPRTERTCFIAQNGLRNYFEYATNSSV